VNRLEDRLTPSVQPISVADPGWVGSNGPSYGNADQYLSRDGRYVAFESLATNLVAGDTNAHEDVFVRDTVLGVTTRVSTASDGTQANGDSNAPALAVGPDGSVYVAFQSNATNLVAGDTNGTWDVFVKNLATGVTTLVSTASDGTQGNGYSPSLAVGPDGTLYVAFASRAGNLVPGDTNATYDVCVKNLTTGATTRVSTAGDGTQCDGDSFNPALAVGPSGSVYVAFESSADNLVAGDTNGNPDVFVKDLASGSTTRVSTAGDGTQADNFSERPIIAFGPNGTAYVAFQSYADNLVAGDTNNTVDVFVKDLATGAITRASTASDGTQADDYSGEVSMAVGANGSVYVAFYSAAHNLVALPTNWSGDAYVKDLTTGVITLASTASDGTPGNDRSGLGTAVAVGLDGTVYVAFQSDATNLVPGDRNNAADIVLKDLATGQVSLVSQRDPSLSPVLAGNSGCDSISPDGRYVVFQSDAGTLVPDDTNGVSDVFVRDTLLGTTSRVSTASDGTQGNDASFGGAVAVGPDGSVYVAFLSAADNLVPGDTNGGYDVFVKDLATGVTTRVNTASDGSQADGWSSDPPALAVGPDGAVYVAFDSSADNLVPGDTNGTFDVFVKDLATGTTTRVSTASDGSQANAYPYGSFGSALAVGPDGAVYVGFNSYADNLVPVDTNGTSDTFVKDLATGVTTRVSTAGDGSQANSYSGIPTLAVAPDGAVYVAYGSNANNLVAGDTNNMYDLFVKDLATGVVTRVNTASDGTQADAGSYGGVVAVGPDGSVYVSFTASADNLVAGDTNAFWDVFVKDLATGVTTRVNRAADGSQANADSGDPALAVGPDGAVYVAFDTAADNLVPGFTPGTGDVYLFSDVAAPVIINPGPQASNELDPVTLAITAQDADGGGLTYIASGLPNGLTIDVASGVVSGVVQAQAAGASPYTVAVSVTDGFHTAGCSFVWTVGVSNYPPTAGVTGPAVAVPGQPCTFTVSATDVSTSDQAAGFRYTVDWGDHSRVETIDPSANNGSGIAVNHVYTRLGPFTVSVTVADQNGAVSQAATTVLTVSQFGLQVDPVDPQKLALVFGTLPGSDNFVRFRPAAGGGVLVLNNGVTLGTLQPTGHIIVYANGANDNVEVAGLLSLPSILFGGAGSDIFYGGGGQNIIVGGSGTNTLYGRSSSELIIGGTGTSTIIGRGGNDLDIAGWTIYDHDIRALAAILAEWASSDDFPTRVADLTGQGNGHGQGLNGNYFLEPGTTVFDNGVQDSITAGAGQELIFANVANGGVLDRISGFGAKDKVIGI
jgi:Tol biopolymer transport system component